MTQANRTPQPLNKLLKVRIMDGKYYCACTDQELPKSEDAMPQIDMDQKTLDALKRLGIEIKAE